MRVSLRHFQVSCICAAVLLIPMSALGYRIFSTGYSDGSDAKGTHVVWNHSSLIKAFPLSAETATSDSDTVGLSVKTADGRLFTSPPVPASVMYDGKVALVLQT